MLKRVTDNLLSNIEKYADPAARLTILAECEGERLHVCFANRARRELARVESNHIGLRTCEADPAAARRAVFHPPYGR